MTAWYNEIDPKAAAWLRQLVAKGLIAPGDVDERSIVDVRAADLVGYTQCHFFAGIGVWSYALRQAGWSDDRPVWTGSCPCQPFSAAGKREGFDDDRHLWPHFHRLIAERRPDVVFGEQVASKGGLAWLDALQDDLEGSNYAVGALDLCAAGIGAPHIRQRLWWVGEGLGDAASRGRREFWDAARTGRGGHADRPGDALGWMDVPDGAIAQLAAGQRSGTGDSPDPGTYGQPDRPGAAGGLEHPGDDGSQGRLRGRPDTGRGNLDGSAGRDGPAIGLADDDAAGRGEFAARGLHDQWPSGLDTARHSGADGLADTEHHDGRPDVARRQPEGRAADARGGTTSGMADTDGWDTGPARQQRSGEQRQQPQDGSTGRMVDANGGGAGAQPGDHRQAGQKATRGTRPDDSAALRDGAGEPDGLANASGERRGESGNWIDPWDDGSQPDTARGHDWTGPVNGHWRAADWLYCRDGKWRPVEPGTFPLAHGTTERVGRLRGYGNAVVAPAAQAFIEAYLDIEADRYLRLTEGGILG